MKSSYPKPRTHTPHVAQTPTGNTGTPSAVLAQIPSHGNVRPSLASGLLDTKWRVGGSLRKGGGCRIPGQGGIRALTGLESPRLQEGAEGLSPSPRTFNGPGWEGSPVGGFRQENHPRQAVCSGPKKESAEAGRMQKECNQKLTRKPQRKGRALRAPTSHGDARLTASETRVWGLQGPPRPPDSPVRARGRRRWV